MRLFSDLGTPYGFRHMDAWTGHSYRYILSCIRNVMFTYSRIRWMKDDGSWVYVKLHMVSMQGVSVVLMRTVAR